MKEIKLPHCMEEASPMLVYHYDKHLWQYDCKFWLVEDKWCAHEDGTHPVGFLQDEDRAKMRKVQDLIKAREIENTKYVRQIMCRKRTCACKNCNERCFCDICKGKILNCDIKKV